MKAITTFLTHMQSYKSARAVFLIEAAGLRTAAASVLPLILGQIAGRPLIGLMVGLGGLNVSITDKPGATPRSMLIAALCAASAFAAGTVMGNMPLIAVSLMFVCAFLGGMLGVYGVVAGQIGFVSTLIFASALGIPARWVVGAERFVEFGLGGLWAALLTTLLWRWTRQTKVTPSSQEASNPKRKPRPRSHHEIWQVRRKRWIRQWRRNLTFRSEVFQHALRLAAISALTVALYKYLPFQHGLWLTITVLVIIKPNFTDTRKRAAERLIGPLRGGVLAFVLAATIHNTVLLDILLLCLSAIAYTHVQKDYGLFVFFLTPFLLLMLNLAEPGGAPLTFARITDTLIGGTLALSAAYVLRPRKHWWPNKEITGHH